MHPRFDSFLLNVAHNVRYWNGGRFINKTLMEIAKRKLISIGRAAHFMKYLQSYSDAQVARIRHRKGHT